jgi:hypothetical protein
VRPAPDYLDVLPELELLDLLLREAIDTIDGRCELGAEGNLGANVRWRLEFE